MGPGTGKRQWWQRVCVVGGGVGERIGPTEKGETAGSAKGWLNRGRLGEWVWCACVRETDRKRDG